MLRSLFVTLWKGASFIGFVSSSSVTLYCYFATDERAFVALPLGVCFPVRFSTVRCARGFRRPRKCLRRKTDPKRERAAQAKKNVRESFCTYPMGFLRFCYMHSDRHRSSLAFPALPSAISTGCGCQRNSGKIYAMCAEQWR